MWIPIKSSNHRARHLRYITELGFDVYLRFYQLPVTCT